MSDQTFGRDARRDYNRMEIADEERREMEEEGAAQKSFSDALDALTAELDRLDGVMRNRSALLITAKMRVRRASLCKAIDGLSSLVNAPAEF